MINKLVMFLNFCLSQYQLYESKQCLFVFLLFYTINYSLRKKLYVFILLCLSHVLLYTYASEYRKIEDEDDIEFCESAENIVNPLFYTGFLLFFSILGILCSMLASFCIKIPNSRVKISLKNRNKLLKNILEMLFLFASFNEVDQYIEQTQFMIGLYRTFLFFILVQFIIYIINKTPETLKEFDCHNTKTNHYDFIYIHWKVSTSYFFIVHMIFCKNTFLVLVFASLVFICIHAIYGIFQKHIKVNHNKHHKV